MNRPIKFRAWDLAEKRMVNFDLSTVETLSTKSLTLDPLMQFTGLTDKNGKEIYEGDYLMVNGVHILEVTWCNGAFKYIECKSMVSMRFGDGWLHSLQTNCQCADPVPQKNLEIVGNIYENPELLSV